MTEDEFFGEIGLDAFLQALETHIIIIHFHKNMSRERTQRARSEKQRLNAVRTTQKCFEAEPEIRTLDRAARSMSV